MSSMSLRQRLTSISRRVPQPATAVKLKIRRERKPNASFKCRPRASSTVSEQQPSAVLSSAVVRSNRRYVFCNSHLPTRIDMFSYLHNSP
ncbi:hypothetical protein SESBI_16445 [Sesbania bispinosa]|nr:hypothetical protein SESBI_16445 [Sesbania bispinosa]